MRLLRHNQLIIMSGYGHEFGGDDDDDGEAVNPEALTVVITHLEDQRFVVKFHEEANVPIAFLAYNPETREYRFKAAEATAVEAELSRHGFNIFREFESYESVAPEVFDQADPNAREDALECVVHGKDVFVTGQGGSGKTQFLRQCLERLGPTAVNISVCSMTGAAAEELDARLCDVLGPDNRVTTLHRCLGIRPDDWKRDPSTVTSRVINIRKRDKVRPFDVFVLDECSMCNAKMFGLVKRVVRAINPDAQMIVAGDFLQLPPVRKEEEPEFLSEFAFKNPDWESLFSHRQFVFEENFRLRGASDKVRRFQAMLTRLRYGEFAEEDVEMLEKEHDGEPTDNHYRVYPRVAMATKHNNERLEKLKTAIHVYKSHAVPYEQPQGQEERTSVEVVPPILSKIVELRLEKEFDPIRLAVGARVMLTRNHMLAEKKVGNGSVGTITSIGDTGVTVRFDNKEEEIMVKPTVVDQLDGGIGLDKIRRTVDIMQMPLRLAWAGTIHLVQSRSVPLMYVNFASANGHTAVFAPGQAYVAMSRVMDPEGFLCVGARTLLEDNAARCNPEALRFYREVLPIKAGIRKAARDAGYNGPDDTFHERLGVPYDRRDTTKEPAIFRPYITEMIAKVEKSKQMMYQDCKRKRKNLEKAMSKQRRKDSWCE